MKGYLYILECADGSYYTGSTNDLERRFQQHQNGEGANHTKKRLPVRLIYFEEFSRIDEAFYKEKQVQGWSRAKKETLINNQLELLSDLANCKNESHYRNAAFDSAQAATRISVVTNRSLSGVETNIQKTNIQKADSSTAFDSAQAATGTSVVTDRSLSGVETNIQKTNIQKADSNTAFDSAQAATGISLSENRSLSRVEMILIIGFVWPEPNSSAAGSRMMQLISLFQSKGFKITFASAAAGSEFMFDVRELGIEKVSIELNNISFDTFILNLQPTIVLFDRFMIEEQFGWRVAEHCPNALRILDTEDLHSLRSARQKAWNENRAFTADDLMCDAAKREVASILRCDLSLIISNVEMDILQEHFKVNPSLLYYLPFMLEAIDTDSINNLPSFEFRKNFITIGNFLHEPNWNAVQYLKEDIWPLIRKKLPEAELHIYGAYPSQKVNELHQPKEGFFIKGRAENANAVVRQARVCLAPLRFGAGIKGKLVEAMICGTPSVTTDIGAEGMHGNFEWSGLIENTPQEIASAAVKLYTDKIDWQKAQENGVQIINNCYSKTSLGAPFIQYLLDLQSNLEKHRLRNFMGAMLMHHTMSSTKYMARWIEAKNKI